jgi:hypothetical protein
MRLAGSGPPARTPASLAEMLRDAAELSKVAASDVFWEPPAGRLGALLVGRGVLFLGRPEPDGARDVYHARVRLAPDGTPLAVAGVRNLTQTSHSDETTLGGRGARAVFGSVAYGRVQSVSVLDLGGIRAGNKPPGTVDRALLAVTAFQDTGTPRGIDRTDVMLDLVARRVDVEVDERTMKLEFGSPKREVTYHFDDGAVTTGGGMRAYGARAVARSYAPKPLILWAVDTVRAEVGPAPIAWLENKVFGARDLIKRAGYEILGGHTARAELARNPQTLPAPALDASALEREAVEWPPGPIDSLWKEPQAGEGTWKPVTLPLLRRFTPGPDQKRPPAYFYTTTIRPDPKRPYAEAQVIAIDMRQLELRMQAGYEDPKPTAGPPGEGRLPHDPDVVGRVVATFNGAFKTTHGEYGMMVDGRVLVPPVRGAASVVVDRAGNAGLGNWPNLDGVPDEIVSFRQNLDPLIEDGKINPTGRYIWGWELEGQGVMTQRTALCVTPSEQLYYVWAEETDGPTLAQTLRQIGCSYGVHLDMNPKHCGFVYTRLEDVRAGRYTTELAHPGMKILPDKYLRNSAKDFFYLVLRKPASMLESDRVSFRPAPGGQPDPSWFPGVFTATNDLGGLRVDLFRFEPGRFDWRIRAGTREPTLLGAPPHNLELGGDDTRRVLGAIGLGHTTEATRYGIKTNRDASLPPRDTYATLSLDGGRLTLLPPGKQLAQSAEEAVQLPLLTENGKAFESARERGARRRRGGLCVTADGGVLLAELEHDSPAPLVTALSALGCATIVELDRGSKHPAFVHLAGTETPPLGRYEGSTLYALGRPMKTTAFRWRHDAAAPSTKPTGFDISLERLKRSEALRASQRTAP